MTGQHISVGLDVGTTKVCAVVADVGRKEAEILGLGVAPSQGLRKGIVINIDATVDSIKKAVREAEVSSGASIKSVSVGISGAHIKGFDSSGAVGLRDKEVSFADISRSIDSAKAVYVPLDREVLHVMPVEFVLDGQDGITNPIGMSGVRLEARVHIITGAASPMQNLLKCCEKAGLEVSDIVFEPLASAHAALTKEEKESGSILVDLGGGTTDIALFMDGSLRYASVIGVGGNHFTHDIAVGLRITMSEAEKVKKNAGAAYERFVSNAEEIQITQAGGQMRTLPRKYLAEILQPRCEEILELVKEEIRKCSGQGTALCGVVVTGGASQLSGFEKMAESVLGLPVRAGSPEHLKGLKSEIKSPVYSTGVGLATYGNAPEAKDAAHAGLVSGAFAMVTDWVKNKFRYADYFNFNNRKEGGVLCLKSRK
jgi:cell division protein FtsA